MKPDWLKIALPQDNNCLDQYRDVLKTLQNHNLNTVCRSARCPNLSECWGRKTATLMILGDTCTRNCRFCAVKTGNPKGIFDRAEPARIAQAVKDLGLNYVVITSVTRDDLPDGGAFIFAETIKAIKQVNHQTKVEVLIPDFSGDSESLKKVIDAQPFVLGHNVETVARLTPVIRDRLANYDTSLELLRKSKELNADIKTKSGFMVGLGETEDEIFTTLEDLKNVQVDIVTIGQYLQPTRKHLPVKDYLRPEQFESFKKYGLALGFKAVFSGPLVRSSYHADSLRLS